MGVRDDILTTIKNKQAIVQGLEDNLPRSRTTADRASTEREIRRQKQEIANLTFLWKSLNPNQPFKL